MVSSWCVCCRRAAFSQVYWLWLANWPGENQAPQAANPGNVSRLARNSLSGSLINPPLVDERSEPAPAGQERSAPPPGHRAASLRFDQIVLRGECRSIAPRASQFGSAIAIGP